MPTNSVYQPTTVTFENSNSLIAQTRSSSRLKIIFHKTWMKILLLIGGLLFLAVGLVIFCLGTVDFEDVMTNDDIVTEFPHEKEFDITLIILGLFFASLGLVLLGNKLSHVILHAMLHMLFSILPLYYFIFSITLSRSLYKAHRALEEKLHNDLSMFRQTKASPRTSTTRT